MDLWEKLRSLLGGSGRPGGQEKQQVPSRGFAENLDYFRQTFGNSADLTIREFAIGGKGAKAAVIYIEHISDRTKIAEQIILPLSSFVAGIGNSATAPSEAGKFVVSGEVEETQDLKRAEAKLLLGYSLLLIKGQLPVLICNTRADLGRSVSTPEVEATILGPKQAFVESMATNLALVRQKLRTSRLRVESYTLGWETQTPVTLLYIDGVAPEHMVNEVKERLEQTTVAEVMDVSYLSELLGISPISPFPQAIYTERPDKVVGNLMEGRVALLADGSPESLVLPAAFTDLFQSPGDYYTRSLVATLLRALRALAFFLATAGPALYVAVVSYDYEILPEDLVVPVASARTGLPFSPIVEALLMLLIVDILQEGSIRLPARIGQTVGVVGGLVLGQAVIQAKLVSPLLLIVVAVAVIGSFAMPNFQVVGLVRLARYVFLFAAAILSGVGIMAVMIAAMIHLSSLTILGMPYLRPIAPFRVQDMTDFILRKPYRVKDPTRTPRLRVKGSGQDES